MDGSKRGHRIQRSQRGDGPWNFTLNHPFGRVKYMLIASQAAGDLIRSRYQLAASGGNPDLKPIYHTPRYTLVHVVGAPPSQINSTSDDYTDMSWHAPTSRPSCKRRTAFSVRRAGKKPPGW